MTEEKDKPSRDLIVMIGMTLSGKTTHVDKNYLPGHQLFSLAHYQAALQRTKIQNPDVVFAAMEIGVRANMIKGLPIVIDERNLSLDSLFLWKTLTREHGYDFKGVFIDTPLDVCTARLKYLLKGEAITEAMHEKLAKEYEEANELKEILKMKHQSIVDNVVFITYDGG